MNNGLQQYRNDIFEMCAILSEQENLRVTVKEAGKGALLVATGAGLGGLLGGRIGLAIGGSITAILAALISKDYKAVPDILRNDLTPVQRRILVNAVGELLIHVGVQNYAVLFSMVTANPALKRQILNVIQSFLAEQFQYEMVSN